MRVLHIHSGNLYGGVETVLVTLASHSNLCPQMESHFALCFNDRLSEELQATGEQVHDLGATRVRNPLSIVRSRRVLRDLLVRRQFDVAVCHSAWSQAIFGRVIRRAGLPQLFWMHNATTGRHWLERWASKSIPDMVVCNSNFTAETVANLYPDAHAEVIYCPIAVGPQNSEADRAAIRAEFGISSDTTVIIQACRMEAWKGHRLLLQSLALLKDLPDWECWQVGGAQRPQEERYLQELKTSVGCLGLGERIKFLGERSDVRRLLAASDIHCQPNAGPEPFGVTFVEALYAGLPVLTTGIGGAREIVNDSCGLLMSADNPVALAASLRDLIQDRTHRARLGAAGPNRARELCDPPTQLAKLNDILVSLTHRLAAA